MYLSLHDFWLKRHGDEVLAVVHTDAGYFTTVVWNTDHDALCGEAREDAVLESLDLLSDLDELCGTDYRTRQFENGRVHLMWAGWVRLTWVCPPGCLHEPVTDFDFDLDVTTMVPCVVCGMSPQTTCHDGCCSVECIIALHEAYPRPS